MFGMEVKPSSCYYIVPPPALGTTSFLVLALRMLPWPDAAGVHPNQGASQSKHSPFSRVIVIGQWAAAQDFCRGQWGKGIKFPQGLRNWWDWQLRLLKPDCYQEGRLPENKANVDGR